jgi:DNA invertase Pin-like site-specific DNA recombinase
MISEPSSPATSRLDPLPSQKLTSRHLERLAAIYVRQSTPQQLIRHQESTRLQYGLVERALSLGWPRERVLVIDDDLGRSGSSAEGRPGFQRLVAEVGLDHVGAIFGIEMSRLARSCKDWHQLLEICSLFGTLIGDLDGLYDPANYNDRLLLGLKGTMSEAELHVLKQRMQQGKLNKARRGELGMRLPIGYVRHPSGQVLKDPDQQAQTVVARIFDQFEARGTVNGVLRDLVENKIQMPIRVGTGPSKGDLEWHRPNRITLSNLLHNPIYAGAYVYGRRPTDPRRKKPGRPTTGRTVAAPGSWQVLLKGHLPAYLSWEQYEANLEQLAKNRARALGVVRKGPALLSGLLVCGRCHRRMSVSYGGGNQRYSCANEAVDYGAKRCQSLAGHVLDEKLSELVLLALAPSALEVSLKVAADIEAEHAKLALHWKQQLERAQYEVDRALRQYNAVEPENRLVARTLEKTLEEKLAAQKTVVHEHDRWNARKPAALTESERDEIRKLAADLPALWNAETTTAAERQTIVRQLVERVVVTVVGETEQVQVQVEWAGGHQTACTIIRPVARTDQLSYHQQLVERIRELRSEGLTSPRMAERLNAEGWRPPKRRATFNAEMVRTLTSRSGLSLASPKRKLEREALRANEWRLPELASKLGMPTVTLYSWLRRGWVKGRQLKDVRGTWALHADAKELARLRVLRTAPKCTWRTDSTAIEQ